MSQTTELALGPVLEQVLLLEPVQLLLLLAVQELVQESQVLVMLPTR